MKSWNDIKNFIAAHQMQYHVIQWNMSNRGCLVGNISDQAIAYTVKDAAKMLRQEVGL
jgi:predicted GNAT family acetyltransferase